MIYTSFSRRYTVRPRPGSLVLTDLIRDRAIALYGRDTHRVITALIDSSGAALDRTAAAVFTSKPEA